MRQASDTYAELELQHMLRSSDIRATNERLRRLTGMRDFFRTEQEVEDYQALNRDGTFQGGREWGDFQTPLHLADQVCRYLRSGYRLRPTVVIEPTFGQGHFIRSAIASFPTLHTVYGVEIQKTHYWSTKIALLHQAQTARRRHAMPEITLFHDDIFRHRFDRELLMNAREELLIIGNPPWITNSELGTLDSANLPPKHNVKAHKGLDALTGKSNFDICESIIMRLLETFQHCNGTLAMLCKNAVAKKIVHELPKTKFAVTDMRLLNIDAKKEFQAATDASLFVIRLNGRSSRIVCNTYKLDEPEYRVSSFGWYNGKFVSDMEQYEHASIVDGQCPFTWRSGIKHDCSHVMELDRAEGQWTNKLNETVAIEDALVYDLLKGTDLQASAVAVSPRKKVIVTQTSIGQNTSSIARDFPKTWDYLLRHRSRFDARKSSIYKGKPLFSIFGVGEYSFAPYKVAISGMHKKSAFALVPPIDGKPVMLDDTCYFLAFDDWNAALFTFALLNGSIVQRFLQSVVFVDEKRPYTKDILMRIDLLQAAERTSFCEIVNRLHSLQVNAAFLTEAQYEPYIELLRSKQ